MNRVCTKLYLEKRMLYRDIPRYTELPNAIPSYTELYPSWYVPSYTEYSSVYTSGILYPWYKVVQDGMYWYEPVRTLVDTRPYKKPQIGTKQYVP